MDSESTRHIDSYIFNMLHIYNNIRGVLPKCTHSGMSRNYDNQTLFFLKKNFIYTYIYDSQERALEISHIPIEIYVSVKNYIKFCYFRKFENGRFRVYRS